MTESGDQGPLLAPVRVIRTMTVSVLLTPLALGLVVLLAVPWGETPPPFLPPVLAAVAIGGVLVAETVGYAAPAIEPGTGAAAAAGESLRQYRSRWLVRAVSTELVLLVGVLLAFMLASRWPYLVAFVLGWPVMAYELWPARRVVDKLNLRLEYAGAPSYLDDGLHGRTPGYTETPNSPT
jgi:hypothetical protein